MSAQEESRGQPASLQLVIQNTVAVMTEAAESKPEWQEAVAGLKGQAQALGRQPEAEFFQSILELMAGEAASLPSGHPYTAALEAIREGISLAQGESGQVQPEMVEALRRLMEARDWNAARAIVEAQQEMLLTPQAEALLESFTRQAEAIGNTRAASMFEFHLRLLQECRADGIPAAFERLDQALDEMENGGPEPLEPEAGEEAGLPADFVERCVQALNGTEEQKEALFGRMRRMAAAQPELAPLAQAVLLALLGDDPEITGPILPKEQRALWDQVRAGWREQEGTSS